MTPDKELREARLGMLIENLLSAMDAWGSWEDGIPAEFAPLIAEARRELRPPPPSSGPAPEPAQGKDTSGAGA